ncbi:MAG: lysophospholipid acyltransferase family protein [Planctomycetota bacterium]
MNSVVPSTAPPAVANYSPWLAGWFQWYLRRMLRKQFHSVAVCRDPRPSVGEGDRLVVYLNHAAWWDPLVGLAVAERFFPGRIVIAPFEAEAMRQYPLFDRLGFFGVDKTSRRGAVDFLRTAMAALEQPATSLWLTPEGRFADPRDAPGFEPGLAHLAAKLAAAGEPAAIVPLAVEYPFWEESRPELLVRFGDAIRLPGEDQPSDKDAWRELLEARLRDAQSQLARVSIGRQTEELEVILGGDAGVGGAYEAFRKAAYRLTGRDYRATHGEKLNA